MKFKFILNILYFLYYFNYSYCNDYCSNGSYSTTILPYKNGCPGYKLCLKGYYCINSKLFKCSAGKYNSKEGINNSNCEGNCSSGYYCLEGSITSKQFKCGNSTVYCPNGSSLPLIIPNGYYGIGNNSEVYESIRICPIGYYCINGSKYSCPPGTYGEIEGLSSSICSNYCLPGYYCPMTTTSKYSFPCPKDPSKYCPQGSSHPIPVALGYYSIKENFHSNNNNNNNNNNMNNIQGGYTNQVLCPAGSYCINGIRYLCPPGRYGLTEGLTNSSCNGLCHAGWYCPLGSISPHQYTCGGNQYYCPLGSGEPILVTNGYFTSTEYDKLHQNEVSMDNSIEFFLSTRTSQTICQIGHYCQNGIMKKCPPGTYGNQTGLINPLCSGLCDEGYYCPSGSTSSKQYQCGSPKYYCPFGSKEPQPVSDGYFTVGDGLATRYTERKCIPGQYCLHGKQFYCLEGYWGGEYGLNISTCSGKCAAGYYCPEGSTSQYEVKCGDSSKYCPTGSSKPQHVPLGYYSIGGEVSTRFDIMIAPIGFFALNGMLYSCPAGRYGNKIGEYNPLCSGPCIKGFYCPDRSISPIMYPCGSDDLFCPSESVAPIQVHSGFYTTFQWSEGCKPGTYRNYTLAIDSTIGEHSFYPTSVLNPPCDLCPNGTYKSTRGNLLSQCLPCPAADSYSSNDRSVCICTRAPGGKPLSIDEFLYFNTTTGTCEVLNKEMIPLIVYGAQFSFNTSVNRYEEHECEPGYYCIEGVKYPCQAGRYGEYRRETSSLCTNKCPSGYFCPPGTSYPYSYYCGGSNLYCPEGSAQPLFVPTGHYSTGTISALTRNSTLPCPPGYYCQGGETFPCPKGRYASSYGTVSSECEGECDPGYYCLEGSNSSKQFKCGNSSVYCPRGSYEPKAVHNGFYCDVTGDSAAADRYWDSNLEICSVELPCEPGSYCLNGARNLCPPGRYGWRYGLNTSECSGLCAAGYYCPSYLEPQPQAPSWTVWPRAPQLKAFEYKCGGVGWFCPAGSWFPQIVLGGYYSVGGETDNTTRRSQQICPPGYYCVNGIIQPCPSGRYGSKYGLADSICSGYCPAGYYCPIGTPEPIKCPPYAYSLDGSSICNTCPNADGTTLTCQDSMTCCFRGS